MVAVEDRIKVAILDVWFDSVQTKVWYVTYLDAMEYQLGESEHFPYKPEATDFAKKEADQIETLTGERPEIVIGTRT